jgi:hypothetical protein
MNCNGKTYPFWNTCNFDLIVFGSKEKAKVNIVAERTRAEKTWDIKKMEIVTRSKS